MILKASQRAGATALGLHLVKEENEHVEVHEVRGFCAESVMGAFKEAQAIARGTRCKQFLFSVSLNPPESASVPVTAFEHAIERIEEQTGLSGQPRVVVFHEKEGRRHAHAVWSRIDAETMTARPLPFFKQKLNAISKGLYLEHGWELPRGFRGRDQRDRASFDLAHWQQCKRMGRDPKALKEAVHACWAGSDNRQTFEAALAQKGLFLTRGDRRAHVAVTYEGEVLSLSRMTGRKTKELAARLGPPEGCRSVEETKEHIARTVAPRLRGLLNENTEAQSRALAPLEATRLAMKADHRERRRELDNAHRQRSQKETAARVAGLRKGVAGLWDRLTGRRKETIRLNEGEALECRARDRAERNDLVQDQLSERRGLQREIVSVRSHFEGEANELRYDLSRHEFEGPKLASEFNSVSGTDSTGAAAASPPRILRSRTSERSGAEHEGPGLSQ